MWQVGGFLFTKKHHHLDNDVGVEQLVVVQLPEELDDRDPSLVELGVADLHTHADVFQDPVGNADPDPVSGVRAETGHHAGHVTDVGVLDLPHRPQASNHHVSLVGVIPVHLAQDLKHLFKKQKINIWISR